MSTEKRAKSWIKWNAERIFCYELEHTAYGVKRHGVGNNIGLVCENLGLDYRIIRTAISKAVNNGLKSCTVSGWTLHWVNIDDWRAVLTSCNVPLAVRIAKVHGKVVKNREDFAAGEYEFVNLLDRFMTK